MGSMHRGWVGADRAVAAQALALVFLLPLGLRAQSPPLTERDYLADLPVVISVSRLPQPVDEVPGAVTVLDRDTVRRSGARDLADLLRLVPGFQTSMAFESLAPLASYHGAFGIFPNRMQVMVDGRPVYSPLFIGGIAPGLQSVALADIERVEVLRGSNSAAYGARAFLGVVNIVTTDAADSHGLRASVTRGESGVADQALRLGWGNGRMNLRLEVDQRTDWGLIGANDDNRVDRFNLRADGVSPSGDEWRLRLGRLGIDAGKGQPNLPGDPVRQSAYVAEHAQLQWLRSLGPDADLLLSVDRLQERYQDAFPYSLLPLGIADYLTIDASGRSTSEGLLLQHTLRPRPALRLAWGLEWRQEQVTSPPLYNRPDPLVTRFSRLFAHAEWRLAPAWLLNAGALVETSSDSGTTLSPRAMLNWHLAPGHTLRAGLSRAWRPPSAFERYADIRYTWNGALLDHTTWSNGQVQAESNTAREIGYLGQWPGAGLSLDVRWFQERIANYIARQRRTQPPLAFEYVNYIDFPIEGLEYQVQWVPWRGARWTFNQAYIDIQASSAGLLPAAVDTTPGSQLYTLPYAAPRLSNLLMVQQQLPQGFEFSLIHQDSGTMIPQAASSQHKLAFTRTDVRLARVFRNAAGRWEAALTVQNLGSPYVDFASDFQFQRRAYATLTWER